MLEACKHGQSHGKSGYNIGVITLINSRWQRFSGKLELLCIMTTLITVGIMSNIVSLIWLNLQEHVRNMAAYPNFAVVRCHCFMGLNRPSEFPRSMAGQESEPIGRPFFLTRDGLLANPWWSPLGICMAIRWESHRPKQPDGHMHSQVYPRT